jgi:drug/metabolite transporter (DMT)-like permease
VAALAMGWSFLHESIAGLALCGALLTLAGVTWGAYQASVPELIAVDPRTSDPG